jgi:hypothetical protein
MCSPHRPTRWTSPGVAPSLAVLVREGGIDLVSLAEARLVARRALTDWMEKR